ncbi:MAG: 2-amino-4-hydroxy-6-hydroxymethyldihydropteridine diphosphokinase [Reyranellaceae bacterium]|jgi:2-amino-4-hydroxy-6-hydroxymethyldihydropteridine diphosphokinase
MQQQSYPILIALGGNLDHPQLGSPQRVLEAALAALARHGIRTVRVSPWYRTAPVPPSDQPWYVNAVAEVATDLPADQVLACLHEVEAEFGRVRSVANAARIIDLDLLDFRRQTATGGPGRAALPHPRLEGRAFVLRPLADLEPEWRHPVTGVSVRELLARLPADQTIESMDPVPSP